MGATVAQVESHGVDWELRLERDDVLPGTTVKGRVALAAPDGIAGRGIVAALVATEQWRYRESYTDSQGHVQTRTVTTTDELLRLPVQLSGPITLAPGERRELDLEVPVAPLGPATLEANASRLTWDLEVKLDREGAFDSKIVVPVRVLQPTALLRAGVVHVGEFALYEAADSATGEARATLEIKPMPICIGAPIDGALTDRDRRRARSAGGPPRAAGQGQGHRSERRRGGADRLGRPPGGRGSVRRGEPDDPVPRRHPGPVPAHHRAAARPDRCHLPRHPREGLGP